LPICGLPLPRLPRVVVVEPPVPRGRLGLCNARSRSPLEWSTMFLNPCGPRGAVIQLDSGAGQPQPGASEPPSRGWGPALASALREGIRLLGASFVLGYSRKSVPAPDLRVQHPAWAELHEEAFYWLGGDRRGRRQPPCRFWPGPAARARTSWRSAN